MKGTLPWFRREWIFKEIANLITINTSYSKEKATEILKRGGYDSLFMDFTRNQETFIRGIAKGVDP